MKEIASSIIKIPSSPKECARILSVALAAINSISQCCSNPIYILDFKKGAFLYSFLSFSNLCGLPTTEILNCGYEVFLRHVPKSEHELLRKINLYGYRFFKRQLVSRRDNFTMFYDFHLTGPRGKKLICHSTTPLFQFSQDSDTWPILCMMSPSSRNGAGNLVVKNTLTSQYLKFDLNSQTWECYPELYLTETEREILYQISQGYTAREIARINHKSVDAIKMCKQRIFGRLDVKSIAEALCLVQNYHLL